MLKVLFLFLMSGGLPVAIAMAGSALVYILWQHAQGTGSLPPFVVIHRMVSGIDSFPLLAVPFFILAGNLMNNAGITNRIYNYALALASRQPDAALAHERMVALGQRDDEVVRVGLLRRLLHLLICCVEPAIAYVLEQ